MVSTLNGLAGRVPDAGHGLLHSCGDDPRGSEASVMTRFRTIRVDCPLGCPPGRLEAREIHRRETEGREGGWRHGHPG
jgi:hypothetical protein